MDLHAAPRPPPIRANIAAPIAMPARTLSASAACSFARRSLTEGPRSRPAFTAAAGARTYGLAHRKRLSLLNPGPKKGNGKAPFWRPFPLSPPGAAPPLITLFPFFKSSGVRTLTAVVHVDAEYIYRTSRYLYNTPPQRL